MPILPKMFTPEAAPNRLSMGNANQGDIQRASQIITRQDYGIFKTLGGDAALGVVDLVDTVTSSIPILSKAFGLEKGTVNASFLGAVDSPGLQDFYNDNRQGVEVASGIYGIIGAQLIANKITKPTSLLMGALKNLPYARRIATLDMQYTRAMKNVRLADETLAARGALGAEQFVGRITLPSEGIAGLAQGARAGTEASRKGLVSTAKWLGFSKGALNAGTAEAIMATTLNQNGFLYTDDYAHNALWAGLGLGIGGAFGSVAAGYAIRKSVNSDAIRRTYANALDPDASEAARTMWHGRSVDPAKFQGLDDIPSGQGFLAGTITDNVTSLLVGARAKTGTAVDNEALGGQALFQNRDRLATQELQLAREEIQKATTKGIEGNGRTRFGNKTVNSSGTMNHLDQVMKSDAGSMHGIEELGATVPGQPALITHLGRESRVNAIILDAQKAIDEAVETGDTRFDFGAAESVIRRYKWKQQFIPVPLIDGERATLSDLQTLDGWVEPEIVRSKLADDVPLWEAKTESSGSRVALDANGQVYLPDNIDLNKADHFDVMRLYRLGNQMIQHSKTNPIEMSLPKNPTWFQLDIAEQLLKVNPKSKVLFPGGMTREAAMVESFAQKAEVLRSESRRGQIKQLDLRRKGKDYDPAVEASKLRVRLNLPKLTAYERGILGESEHPVERLLRGAAEYGPDEIRKLGLTDLMRGASDVKRIGDFAPTAASDFKTLQGNSFKYMLDDFDQPTKPILMYSRPMNAFEWAPDHLAERMAAARLNTMTKLMEGDTFTSNLSKALMSSSDMNAASKTRELMETQIQGSTFGSNHLGPEGALAKSVKTRDYIGRDNLTLLSASRLQEMTQRLARDNFQQEAKGLQTVASQLDSPRNAASKLLLNQFIAYRPGWDLAVKKGVPLTVDGVVGTSQSVKKFLLAPTEKNAARWKEMFGEEMPSGATLRGPNGREVILDDFGGEFMKAFNGMTESVRQNKNQLLRANGLRQIDALPMYVPPTNLDGKLIGFTMDTEGNVVSGMTVIANTEAEFATQQAKILKQIEDQGLYGYRFRTRDDVKRFADIWDRAQMDMIDPGTTAIQGGKNNRGLLAAPDIDLKGVEGILNTLRSQYINHAQDVLTVTMKDSLQSAEARSNIATGLSRNAADPNTDQKYRSIHEMYIENLTGKSPLKSKGSIVGKFYNAAEGSIDQFLRAAQPGFARTWAATNAFIDRGRFWETGEGARKDFDSLTTYLGDYMPFKTAAEYVERQGAGGMPTQLKDIMGTTSRFTAAVMLRIFEPAMAVMNLAGMVNAMPAVIRHVQQQAGETAAEHAARVGQVADIFEGAGRNGESIGVLSMGKIMAKGFNRAWSKKSLADYDYMRRNGYLTQEVAEFQRQFGSIETKADWQRFMFGSEAGAARARATGTNFGKVSGRIQDKGIVGWMSVLTDKSEDFSRSWGHMVGVELAETLGIRKLEAKHAFAHDLANKMIANYNPANRPEVFQGALGAPLGLFQSFIQNYYQRMFRYIETGDLRSLAVQSATQAGLFGVPTVPGFSEASKLFFNASGGEIDPVQAIQEKFGQSAGDLLYGGTLSNIPKLFGAEGVDLYSRGDTSVRLPVISGMPPALSAGKKIIDGLAEGMKLFSSKNPDMTTTQIAEVMSNTVPNRPLAGMIEQFFAGGNDVDGAGQIASDTQSQMEGVYRMLGVRSMRQSKELEAFYSNKNQMSLQNSQMDMLRKATRTAFRENNMDAVPLILEKYIEQGGDPRNARRWMKEQFEAATQTRGERQLDDTLKSEDKMGYAIRLLDAGVSIDDDEQTVPYSESLAVDSSEFGGVNNQMMDYDTDAVQNSMDMP